jgi:hypothetical protein
MRPSLIRSIIVLLRAIEFAGGIVTALLGLFIYFHIVIKDASLPRASEVSASELSAHVVMFLMLVIPSIVVAAGIYLQVIHRKPWAVPLVFVGGISNLIFVGINAGFLFAYTQDLWGQRAVFADLVFVILTLVTAFINLLVFPVLDKAPMMTTTT